MTSEQERLKLIESRDGPEAARRWARETLDSYREAVDDPGSHASHAPYRARFREAIAELENWLRERAPSSGGDR